MRHFPLTCLLLMGLTVFLPIANAQDTAMGNTEENTGNSRLRYWELTLDSASKKLMVRLDTVTSYAMHTYLIDGKIPCSELTIDSMGNNSIRIYYIEEKGHTDNDRFSNTRELLKEKSASVTGDAPVAKKFPEGTHSHNIEYRVSKEKHIKELYDSFDKAWKQQKNTRVSPSK